MRDPERRGEAGACAVHPVEHFHGTPHRSVRRTSARKAGAQPDHDPGSHGAASEHCTRCRRTLALQLKGQQPKPPLSRVPPGRLEQMAQRRSARWGGSATWGARWPGGDPPEPPSSPAAWESLACACAMAAIVCSSAARARATWASWAAVGVAVTAPDVAAAAAVAWTVGRVDWTNRSASPAVTTSAEPNFAPKGLLLRVSRARVTGR